MQLLKQLHNEAMSIENAYNELVREKNIELFFRQEIAFALEAIKNNEYLRKVAVSNMQSFKTALMNTARYNISLNPALQEAYLVPRGKQITFFIGWRGLANFAARQGLIKRIEVDLVREDDTFQLQGLGARPIHQYDPFDSERMQKSIRGVYCVTIFPDDSVLVTTLNKDQIEKRRRCSESGFAWQKWYDEMACKTVVRYASKQWLPYSGWTQVGEEAKKLLFDEEFDTTSEQSEDDSPSQIAELLQDEPTNNQ